MSCLDPFISDAEICITQQLFTDSFTFSVSNCGINLDGGGGDDDDGLGQTPQAEGTSVELCVWLVVE